MDEGITIRVFEVVGSSICVASDDGQYVFERIAAAISSGRSVVLSFANVTSLTSAFLNTALGQLYSRFSELEIREHLKLADMNNDDAALLKRVVDTAKRYFSDPARFEHARDHAMGHN